MYQVTINAPGYLPMSDEPHVFESMQQAWEWLRDERQKDLDDVDYDEPDMDKDQCLEELDGMIDHPITGVVYGCTPGYDGDHDLGLAYSVVEITHADYPHEPGCLYDCLLCESRCFCTGDPGHTLCLFCATAASR